MQRGIYSGGSQPWVHRNQGAGFRPVRDFPYSLILAAIGLIELLLTLNLIDEMTDTRGKPNRECVAQKPVGL